MKQTCLLSVIVFAFVLSMSSCAKEYSFEFEQANGMSNDSLPPPPPVPGPSPIALALNTWQFSDSNNGSFHHGIIDTVGTRFDINPVWNYLIIKGWPVNSGGINYDTMFLIALFLPTPVIETGTYVITSGVGGEHLMGYGNNTILPPYGNNQNFCYYLATPDITPTFTIRIIAYDTSQRILKGSFSGPLKRRAGITDYSGSEHSITGSFFLRLNS